jgi:hypothetical protein
LSAQIDTFLAKTLTFAPRNQRPSSTRRARRARGTSNGRVDRVQCERCDMRSPLRVENADVVKPAGWHLEDVHLCCVEHTTVDGVPRADRLTSAATPTPQPRATPAQRWEGTRLRASTPGARFGGS